MSQEVIIGVASGGGGIVLAGLLLLVFHLLKLIHKSKVNETSKEALLETKVERLTDVVISNQNILQAPDLARKAINELVQIRTDNTDKIALEAQKAKAAKKALKPRAIKRTKSAQLI